MGSLGSNIKPTLFNMRVYDRAYSESNGNYPAKNFRDVLDLRTEDSTNGTKIVVCECYVVYHHHRHPLLRYKAAHKSIHMKHEILDI